MLAGVLEYKSIEGYPGAVRALGEATWLGALGGVRVRDRIMPRRLFAYKHATVRTRSKERATGRAMQVEADQTIGMYNNMYNDLPSLSNRYALPRL